MHFWKNPHRQANYYLTILAIKIENPFSPSGVKVKHKIYALLVTVFDDAVDMPFISVISI